jgi:lipopolysaccharide/colanic/teichoic acid biosynthesis glycosyltransferase
VLKRVFDVSLALVGLFLALPILLAVALAVKLESPGPILFSQERLGKGGKVFRIRKFRKFPARWTNVGAGVTLSGDARMTRVGRVLEKTKLDELPQLWNIVCGEMSFVGPRPETLRFADLFVGPYRKVLDFTPGVLGPHQVLHRTESDLYPADCDPEAFYREVIFVQKARMDLEYFSRSTFVDDVLLLVRGVFATVVGVVDWRGFLATRAPRLIGDVLLVAAAWVFAVCTLSDTLPRATEGPWFLPICFASAVAFALLAAGCYRCLFRYFNASDSIRLVIVVTLAWTVTDLVLRFLAPPESAAPAYSVVAWAISLLLLGAVRLFISYRHRALSRGQSSAKTLLIYGAIPGGFALSEWVQLSRGHAYRLIGFLDDSADLRGCTVNGLPVLGRESDLQNLHAVQRIDELWLTFEPAAAHFKRVQHLCDELGIRLSLLHQVSPLGSLIGLSSRLVHDAG